VVTLDEYRECLSNVREAGEIARQNGVAILFEFLRDSPFVSTLPITLKLIREAGHSNVRTMIDVFHFWAGPSKFEDLDLPHRGEIAHIHFEDTPDLPREILTDSSRVIPGDGAAPLVRILRKLAEKGYGGPLSVELFGPAFQQGDPFEVARRIREKTEAVKRQAGVL